MSSKRRAPVATGAQAGSVAPEDIPQVGQREPCPCGSGKRYKNCHGRAARAAAVAPSARPFEGITGECDWVALREIVPSATATVRTTAEHGGAEITVATVLPLAWPALHRTDGAVLIGLQTQFGSGDAGRDAAHALLAGLAAAPGTPVTDGIAPPGTPALSEILDPAQPFEVTVHDGFDFWIGADTDLTADVRASLEQANSAVIPTVRLTEVEAAYWCDTGTRRHLRWVMPHAEEQLLDAFARLSVADALTLGEGTRYAGAFRSQGLLVPVWDLPADAEAQDVEKPAAAFAERLAGVLTDQTPLTARERGARAGVVSRQVTLR